MSAARACVEAWREATKEVRHMDNLAGWDTAKHEDMALLEAERALSERLAEALRVALPLAKGYAYRNRVGRNAEMLMDAEDALAEFDARHGVSGGKGGE